MKNKGMIALAISIAVISGILIAGCIDPETTPGQPVNGGGEEEPVPPSTDSPKTITDANNRFAFDLYKQLAGDQQNSGKNIFFSPFSISAAFGITSEGARGRTADEIRAVFYFPEEKNVQREGFKGIIEGINSGASAYVLKTANAMWAEQTYPFLPEFIETADRYYNAKTTNLDFIGHPEESRITINNWVEEQTEDRIKDLIPAGEIDSATTLVITNAIYFKGTWVKQFDENKTQQEDFRTGSGNTVRVPMMQRTDEDAIYGYAETDTLQVLSMPYASDGKKNLSMLVILPRGDDLPPVENTLDADALAVLQKSLESQRVRVFFPKYTMETKYFLPRTLADMGMPTAFTGGADFSGMDGTGGLFISNVIHQAFVEVNEEGTEAAAATAVIILKSAAPAEEIPVFRADHPFIFLIQDDETGNILFMGRVMNPVS